MYCSTSSLSSSLSSSSSSLVNLFLLGKNHEATNPKQIHERTREEKKISSSSWKKRRRRKKRNTNAKNNAIVDDDVNVELQDGVIGARDARLYAQTKRLEDLETTVKKNVEEDKEDNKEGNSRDFLHESLGITYRLVEKGKQQDLECDLDALNDVFVSVNFSRRPNDKLYLALEKSYLCCFAEVDVEYETRALDVNNNSVESTSVETRRTRREVIGFARMTSDAAFVGTVWDLVVAPPYQGKGIGTAIVERMIAKAKETAPGMVVNLCAVAEAENMYKRIGFRKNEEEVIAMQFNPALQAMNRFQSVNFSIQ